MRERGLETILIHGGEPKPRIGGAAVVPVFQSAVFEQGDAASYDDLQYPRLNNTPNHRALHRKLALLEGAEDAVVTASGMAAIATTLVEVASPGGHVLAQRTLYGGTHAFLTQDAPRLGIACDLIDPVRPESWTAALRPQTRAIYTEAITNPLLEVAEHEAVIDFARRHGLVSIIDATFASPVNYRPVEHGYTIAIHSGTKYLNGHSDLVCGAVIGAREWVTRIRHRLNHLGGCLDPHACFLLHRGLKTLALRVRQQNASAQRLAEFLESHPAVGAVYYPGLASSPHHERARRWFAGCGGVLSFELPDGPTAQAFVDRLEIPVPGPSLGGVDTLVTRPVTTSHLGVPPAEREAMGVRDGLVRISVGIETTEDLIDDLDRALSALEVPRTG